MMVAFQYFLIRICRDQIQESFRPKPVNKHMFYLNRKGTN